MSGLTKEDVTAIVKSVVAELQPVAKSADGLTMSVTERQFVNALAERLDNAEGALESFGNLGEQIDGLTEMTKNFDFGSEISQIKSVLGQVCQLIGLNPGEEAAPALAAEGGVEKGDQVVSLGEHGDARKKEGMNFAAELMPIAKQGGLVGILAKMAEDINALQSQSTGRTAAEVTGEPVEKRAAAKPLFHGKF